MKARDVIDDRLSVIETLLKLLRKKVDLTEIESHKYKAIVEGRKQAFESAYNQITRVNQLEDKENIGDDTIHRARFQRLIDSMSDFLKVISKIAKAEIDVDESEDDKVKSIVQSKDLACDLEEHVLGVKQELKKRLSKETVSSDKAIRNFASERVKNG